MKKLKKNNNLRITKEISKKLEDLQKRIDGACKSDTTHSKKLSKNNNHD